MNLTAGQAMALLKVANLPIYGVHRYEHLLKFVPSEDNIGYYSIDMQTNTDTRVDLHTSNLDLFSSIDEAVKSMQDTITQNKSIYTKRLAFYNYLESNYPESFI